MNSIWRLYRLYWGKHLLWGWVENTSLLLGRGHTKWEQDATLQARYIPVDLKANTTGLRLKRNLTQSSGHLKNPEWKAVNKHKTRARRQNHWLSFSSISIIFPRCGKLNCCLGELVWCDEEPNTRSGFTCVSFPNAVPLQLRVFSTSVPKQGIKKNVTSNQLDDSFCLSCPVRPPGF